MHAEAHGFVARTVEGRRFRSVVEFGSRNVNGTVRGLFVDSEYVGVDIAAGPGVDVVADVVDLTVDPCDAVVCCEMLEHTPYGGSVVAAAHRALAPGGLLIVTCATTGREPHSASDGGQLPDGEHYANVGAGDLLRWLIDAGFTSWQFDGSPARGDLYCTATA